MGGIAAWEGSAPPRQPACLLLRVFGAPPAEAGTAGTEAGEEGKRPPWQGLNFGSSEPVSEAPVTTALLPPGSPRSPWYQVTSLSN